MKDSKGKVNKKIVALIIEVTLLVISSVIVLVLDSIKIEISIFVWIAIYTVLLFALVFTLILIKNARLREIRTGFKETNLPLYTDTNSLRLHDIIDEDKNHEPVDS